MTTAAVALSLYLVYLALAFGVRAWLFQRRTGSMAYRGLSGPAGSLRWWGGVLFIVALAAGLASPVLQLTGLIAPFDALNVVPMHIAGTILTLTGIAATLLAQQAMGRNWRVGVDETESTELVRSGVFAIVRNPVFTAMLITAAGFVLLTPNPVALGAFVALFVAIELQVRTVEEPHLLAVHGDTYRGYTRAVGRFVPRIGTH